MAAKKQKPPTAPLVRLPLRALENGVYRLTQDVVNTQRDRRVTREWQHEATWEKGTKFVIQSRFHRLGLLNPTFQVDQEISLYGGYAHQCWVLFRDRNFRDDHTHPDLPALLDALEEVPLDVKTFGTVFFQDANDYPAPSDARAILTKLVTEGVVTLEQAHLAWLAVQQDEEREAEEWDKAAAERSAAKKEKFKRDFFRPNDTTGFPWVCSCNAAFAKDDDLIVHQNVYHHHKTEKVLYGK